MEEFLKYLEYEKNYSKNTIIAYQNNIIKFDEFMKNNNINSYKDINYNEARMYISYLYNENYSAKSINRMISALRSFFKYLKSESKIDNNAFELISSPKIGKKLPKYLTINDVEKILDACSLDSDISIRDSLILELLYVTGIRVSELVGILIKNISLKERKIKIFGKGSKERYVYYGSRCEKLIQEYLKIRSNFLKENNIDYLILSKTGRQLNVKEVRNIINRIKTKAGVDINISPHTFRHTFATHMLNEGADLRSVQELLGHENLSTTTIYTHLTDEKLRRTYLSSHPRARK